MLNNELPDDPKLPPDVLDVQKSINDYRNKMLKQIRCGEDGNFDVKDLEERIKFRQMMIKESEGSIVGLSEASTAVTEPNWQEKRTNRTGPKFYLRTH